MESFGKKLKRLRVDADMSQTELIAVMKLRNKDISISKSMISKWENGHEEPSRFGDVATMAEVFNVSTDYLIGLTMDSEESPEYKRIPILGSIAAGLPILAQEDIEGYENVPIGLRIDFCLRVKGDSMIGARIMDGDLVYMRQQSDVEDGEIAAVLIDSDTATLKRVYKVHGKVILRAENPNYPEMVYAKTDMVEVRIIGLAIEFKSKVR